MAEKNLDKEQLLYRFFVQLLNGDMTFLEQFENQINDSETAVLSGSSQDVLQQITAWRRELLRLKHYYEQLDMIFDEMAANDNGLLSADTHNRIIILGQRTDRYLNKVCNLQELVSQLREAYQSELSIEQNNLMKVFTVLTAIFLPLTLVTGWYGMNFAFMPELQWKWSYPIVFIVGIVVVIGLIRYFKRKKWL